MEIIKKYKAFLPLVILFSCSQALPAPNGPNDLSAYYGFREMEVIKLQNNIFGLTIADLNADGLKDMAIANNRESKINLLIQKEQISMEESVSVAGQEEDVNILQAPTRFSRESIPVTQQIYSLVSGDLNGDGNVDLAFYGEPKGIYVFLQKKTGESEEKKLTWRRKKRIEIDDGLSTPQALACGDLNNDGTSDLALAARESVYIIFQKQGVLSEPVKYASMSRLTAVNITDGNGDKINDLLLTTTEREMPIQMRFGLATGQLGPQIGYFIERPYKLELSNIDDRQGKELLTIDHKGGRLNCYKYSKMEKENYHWPIFYYPLTSGEGTGERDLCVGDFNGDGLSDIIISDPAAAELIFYKQAQEIGLLSPVRFPAFSNIRRLTVADIDRDGKDELGVLSVEEKVIGLAQYQDQRLLFPEPLDVAGEPLAMEFQDVDNDEKVDCVYISKEQEQRFLRVIYDLENASSEAEAVLMKKPAALQEQNRTATKAHQQALKLKELSSNPDGLKVLDADQDGLLDVLVFVKYEFPIFIKQKEPRNFQVVEPSGSRSSLIKNASLRTLCSAEVDGDEGKELLIAQENFARSLIFSNQLRWNIVDQYNAKNKENKVAAVGGFKVDGQKTMSTVFLLDAAKGKLQILKPGKDQTYRFEKQIDVGTWNTSYHLKMDFAPLTGDQYKSIVLFDGTKFALITLKGQNYAFERLFSYETKIKDGLYGNLVVGDINSDERTDITMVDYKGKHIEILALGPDFKPVPAMRFKVYEQKSYQRSTAAGKSEIEPREMQIKDVTGDGKDDLVTVIHDRIIIYPQD